MPTLLQVYTTI